MLLSTSFNKLSFRFLRGISSSLPFVLHQHPQRSITVFIAKQKKPQCSRHIYFSLIIPELILVMFRHITIEAEITLLRTQGTLSVPQAQGLPGVPTTSWQSDPLAASVYGGNEFAAGAPSAIPNGQMPAWDPTTMPGEPMERLQARTLLAKHMHRHLFPSFHPLRQFRSRCLLTGLLPMHGLPRHPRVSLLTTLHELFNVLCYFQHHKIDTPKHNSSSFSPSVRPQDQLCVYVRVLALISLGI
uniref:Uncharacterized protein n=1 Tax=Ananas comosus var. bracteatus TaxID=296719 RepID=A0A6V7P6P7_ANACO|nr:unnamed protein product [Ananas comosus var. bracteatus]